jgi:LPS export ABC transporter protein LptC
LKKKILLILSLLLFLGGGVFYLVRQVLRDPSRLPIDLPKIARHLEFELENVRYGHTRSGVKKWELSTLKARRIKGRDEILLEGVKARIYADGKLESDTRIEADRGSYVVESGDMRLEGRVKIINRQFQITTERLRYQEALEEISAPESLIVNSEKLKIEADRATIDLRRQQLHFSGAVRARIRVSEALPEVPLAKPEAKTKVKESLPEPSFTPEPVVKTKPAVKKVHRKIKPLVNIGKR